MHFWKSCQRIQPKNFDSSAKGLKLSNKIGSFRLKQNSSITVLWSRRMPLSQPCQNLSIGQKNVGSTSEATYATKYIIRKSSSKFSSGCVGGSFHQHAKLLFRIHFLWRKSKNKVDFYSKKIFPRNIPMHTLNANLPIKRTKIQKPPALTLKKIIQTTSFLEKPFHGKTFPVT